MNDAAIDGLMQRRRSGRKGLIFSVVLHLVTMTVFLVAHFRIAAAFEAKLRFATLVDSDTLVVFHEKDFEEAKTLHIWQAKQAVQAMFNRGPKGLDNEELLKRFFNTSCFKEFQGMVKAENPEFEAKQIHQKVEVADIKILKLLDGTVRVAVYGQLIRIGHFSGQVFSEALTLEVTLLQTENPAYIQKGRFPTTVTEFDVKTQPIPSL